MTGSWKRLDLGGGGLQEANLRLARRLRSRRAAYAAWAGFALGLHRLYLREPLGAGLYVALSCAALLLLYLGQAALAAAPAGIALGLALADLWWIDRRVTRLNKALRMQAYLRDAPGAPQGFRGRFGGDDR